MVELIRRILSVENEILSIGYKENYKYVFVRHADYGADQTEPKRRVDKYKHIVKKYYPDYSDEEVETFLKKLSSEGCGYAAIVNAIFLKFYEEQDKYQSVFGFPYKDSAGYLNFSELLVDFYCKYDNHYSFFGSDMVNKREDKSKTVGYGTTQISLKWRTERYLRDHKIKAELISVNVTPKNYERISKRGPIFVSVNPTTLYDENGKKISDSTGGHTMLVTGVKANLLRVTSWGKEYYVKPRSYTGHEYYQQLLFKDRFLGIFWK